MLALRFRAGLVPEGAVQAITGVLRVFFLWPVVGIALLAMGAVDAWLFFVHGVARGAHDVLYQPMFFLVVLGLVILSAAFHECGHASACRHGGARPGVLGAGIYLVWPAFYSDVTDAYRLGRVGRLRTDLGGVYFNVIFMLAATGAYAITHFEPLLVFILVQHFEILHQFLPFLRLDGYYVVADLTGVPDMFQRIKPTLKSVIPGQEPDQRVTELKNWVRVAVTVWVVLTAAFVIYAYGLMVINAPRIIGTAIDSLGKQLGSIGGAFGKGNIALAVLSLIQVLILALTLLGVALTLYRTAKALVVGGWKRTEGRPVLRGGFVLLTTAAAVVLVFLWLPKYGNYRPISPNEAGTVQGSFVGFAQRATNVGSAVQNPTSVTQQPAPSPTPITQPSESPSPSSGPSTTPVTSPSATP
jgi:putative peptide zinc metalloprotease protein